MMKKLATTLFVVGATVIAGTANAQFAKAEDAIEYRQSAFKLMGSHLGRMGPVAKGQMEFDQEALKANIEILKVVDQLPYTAFGDGTQGGDALDKIWDNKDDFNEKAEEMQAAIVELSEAVDTGELNQFKAAFGKAGQTCKSCHTEYRKR